MLVGNLIGFGWVIFLTAKRRKLQNSIDAANRTKIVVTDSDAGTSEKTGKKSNHKKH